VRFSSSSSTHTKKRAPVAHNAQPIATFFHSKTNQKRKYPNRRDSPVTTPFYGFYFDFSFVNFEFFILLMQTQETSFFSLFRANRPTSREKGCRRVDPFPFPEKEKNSK
jgi:hypothetical protein